MKHIKLFLASFFVCIGLTGCTQNASAIKIQEPVILGSAFTDKFILILQMYEGTYDSVLDMGPAFGPNWTGKYELIILNKGVNEVVYSYKLKEWSELLNFKENFELNLTDYNEDGIYELLIGQYGSNNYNIYKMYYIKDDLEIGYYAEIGELEISSKELSPRLEVRDGNIIYSVYNISNGVMVDKEISLSRLEIKTD